MSRCIHIGPAIVTGAPAGGNLPVSCGRHASRASRRPVFGVRLESVRSTLAQGRRVPILPGTRGQRRGAMRRTNPVSWRTHTAPSPTVRSTGIPATGRMPMILRVCGSTRRIDLASRSDTQSEPKARPMLMGDALPLIRRPVGCSCADRSADDTSAVIARDPDGNLADGDDILVRIDSHQRPPAPAQRPDRTSPIVSPPVPPVSRSSRRPWPGARRPWMQAARCAGQYRAGRCSLTHIRIERASGASPQWAGSDHPVGVRYDRGCRGHATRRPDSRGGAIRGRRRAPEHPGDLGR